MKTSAQPNERPLLADVLATIDVRRRVVGETFDHLLRTSPLLDILGRNKAWAIVGGAVRDLLLGFQPGQVDAYFLASGWDASLAPWRDLDIAVSGPLADVPFVRTAIAGGGVPAYSPNSFGGA